MRTQSHNEEEASKAAEVVGEHCRDGGRGLEDGGDEGKKERNGRVSRLLRGVPWADAQGGSLDVKQGAFSVVS